VDILDDILEDSENYHSEKILLTEENLKGPLKQGLERHSSAIENGSPILIERLETV
jgi:hypothetical protein